MGEMAEEQAAVAKIAVIKQRLRCPYPISAKPSPAARQYARYGASINIEALAASFAPSVINRRAIESRARRASRRRGGRPRPRQY